MLCAKSRFRRIRAILLNPISTLTLAILSADSLVGLIAGLAIVRSANALSPEGPNAKRRAWRMIGFAITGAIAFFVSESYLQTTLSSAFFSYVYFGFLGAAPFLGLVAAASGAWFTYSRVAKAAQG